MRGEPSSLSSALAPGFRFHPTDEELVSYYLKRKVCGKSFRFDAISEIDIYKSEPWDLPGQSRLKSRDLEWYFFSALDKKYGNGWRTNRATDQGYWKTTGKDRSIQRGNRTVGMKKTLVYHIGRAPRGERTNWVMHEYRLVDDQLEKAGIVQEAFVLCRIFQKSGTGPKNGEQYGAPFIEEEWDEDVSIPGEEVGVGYLVAGDEQSSPPQDDAQNQNLALTIPPLNAVVLVDHDTEDDGKFVEDLNRLLDEDQKPSIDSDENDIQADLPEQDFFDFPEQFQMDQAPVKNEYFELDDLLDPVDNRNDDLVTEEFLNYAATNDQPVVHDGLYLEIDDLGNPVETDKSGFQMFDDHSTYFDASEDYLNYLDLDFIKSSDVNDFNLNKLSAPQEAEKALQQAYLEPSVLSKTLDCENASSSEHKLDNKNDAPDVEYNDGWDSTIAKQVSRMLGSISAPPAFASELLAEEASLGQKSTSQSSSTNHVTAGMIHISSTGVTGNEINSSWGKSEYMDLLLHFDLTRSGPVTVEHVMQGKAGSIVARSMLYFFFLWVLILSVSWKVGSCIYSR